jgi:hypothetical protein
MTSELILHRARNYPYDRAAHSFVYRDGSITPLGEDFRSLVDGHHPVLAFGSNAAPEQLKRKYANHSDVCFAVTKATLQDYDVVYSAHLTSYGAVPATLAPSPGTRLETWITWLDDDQLKHMHQTEMGAGGGADVNYAYGHLQDVDLEVDDLDAPISSVGVYLSNYGALAIADGPLAFTRIEANNRVFEERDKLEVLETVRELVAADHSPEAFIHAVSGDKNKRAAWGEVLKTKAFPLAFPDFVHLVP